MKVNIKQIVLETTNGFTHPVFITEDGKRYIPRYIFIGSCWITDWIEEVPVSDK